LIFKILKKFGLLQNECHARVQARVRAGVRAGASAGVCACVRVRAYARLFVANP